MPILSPRLTGIGKTLWGWVFLDCLGFDPFAVPLARFERAFSLSGAITVSYKGIMLDLFQSAVI